MMGGCRPPRSCLWCSRATYCLQESPLAQYPRFVFQHIAWNLDISDDQRPVRCTRYGLQRIRGPQHWRSKRDLAELCVRRRSDNRVILEFFNLLDEVSGLASS